MRTPLSNLNTASVFLCFRYPKLTLVPLITSSPSSVVDSVVFGLATPTGSGL